ncbi:MAG: hypothetical protein MUF60_00285 [Vicinamibacterales bacterium]|nr:hypothetical protein [Vicinamibacterales bacterium]
MAVRDQRLAALALFALLTVAHTWPLATAPATLSRNDNADAQLNAWILAWVPHAVVSHPLRLFDANIFHPDRHTLAYSEHLFAPAMMGAPLTWAGASPVLVHNLLLLAGLALTGWTTWLVLYRWTGDWSAAVLGGCLAAFNAHTLTRTGHVQAMHAQFLPLALLALDRLIAAPSARRAVALAGWFTLQSLCSLYFMAMAAIALVAGALARAAEWTRRDRFPAFARAAALAFGIALVLCLPFLLPYAEVRRDQGLLRSMDEVALYSADWRDYLTTAGRLHYAWWSHHFFRSADALFPGVTALLLAGVALAGGTAWRDRRARLLLAAGVAGVVLSFGAKLPGYEWLHTIFPLLQGTRATTRFGYLGLVAVAGLAAFGLAAIRQRTASPRMRAALTVAALALVTLEAGRAPMAYTPYLGIPAVYDRLADEPDAVVVEFPFYSPHRIAMNARYVLASTRHWRPLVNGYSGVVPDSYVRHNERFRGFPDDTSLEALREAGVTHVVVHLEEMEDVERTIAARDDLLLMASAPGIRIYRLR